MIARISIAALLGICCYHSAAQPNWKGVGNGLRYGANEVQTLFADTVFDRLLAGGTFLEILNLTDTVLGVGRAQWNGWRWDSLAHRIQPITGNISTQQTFWFQRFQGDLYSCGNYNFPTGDGVYNASFARLNEQTMRWEALECINPSSSSLNQLVQKTPGAQHLYATGYAGSICGYPQANVFRYDGSAFHEWEPWAQIPEYQSNYVGYVFEFQGMTYVTGVFRDPHSSGFLFFARVNNGVWEPVPGWGNAYHIRDVLIKDDVLYVCGTFKMSNGAPGNMIASFDGENWSNLDGGLSLQILPGGSTAMRMKWHDGHLYVAGVFDHAGGLPLNGGLAIWNGNQWSGLPGAFHTWHPNVPDIAWLRDIAFWRDSLYICGNFDQIDNQPISEVAQFLGVLPSASASGSGSIAQVQQPLRCYTTDEGSTWVIDLPDEHAWRIDLFNSLGQAVITLPAARSGASFSVRQAQAGIYLLHASNAHARISLKVLMP